MYEQLYGFKEKPFSIQPDPDFLFLGKRHELAYAILQYAVQNRAGFAVLCGEVGCGKTTLVRKLLDELHEGVTVGLVYNTHQDIANPLEWINLAFGLRYDGLSQVAMYDGFQQFLIAEYAAGRRVLLIVDEAQNLSAGALEFLRMLSNINADKDQLLQVLLVGQPELDKVLMRPELRQFSQRISTRFYLPPLSLSEAVRYIHHRLAVAGRASPLFTVGACVRIANAASCIPRSINVLCDTALVYGFAAGSDLIDVDTVDEMISDRDRYATFPGAGQLPTPTAKEA